MVLKDYMNLVMDVLEDSCGFIWSVPDIYFIHVYIEIIAS
jgi:hypothetical protein